MDASSHFGKLVLKVPDEKRALERPRRALRARRSAMTILRSLLFVPGNKSSMLEKALGA